MEGAVFVQCSLTEKYEICQNKNVKKLVDRLKWTKSEVDHNFLEVVPVAGFLVEICTRRHKGKVEHLAGNLLQDFWLE